MDCSGDERKPANTGLAEREGFEPPIPLRVCRISSAVLSTTQPPLRSVDLYDYFGRPQVLDLVIATEIAAEKILTPAFQVGFSSLERHIKLRGAIRLAALPRTTVTASTAADRQLGGRPRPVPHRASETPN